MVEFLEQILSSILVYQRDQWHRFSTQKSFCSCLQIIIFNQELLNPFQAFQTGSPRHGAFVFFVCSSSCATCIIIKPSHPVDVENQLVMCIAILRSVNFHWIFYQLGKFWTFTCLCVYDWYIGCKFSFWLPNLATLVNVDL